MPNDAILWGSGSAIVDRPAAEWLATLQSHALVTREAMRLAGADRAIREFVVRELPAAGAPLAPCAVARALSLDEGEVERRLADLERRLFFLVRNDSGEVSWAFPVTAQPTPHRIGLASDGDHWENIFGA